MHDLTGFQRNLLYVVAGLGGPKGLTIKEELDEYHASEINHGRLYPNLDTLVEIGLIDKDEKDDRTNECTMTNRGQGELKARRDGPRWKRNVRYHRPLSLADLILHPPGLSRCRSVHDAWIRYS